MGAFHSKVFGAAVNSLGADQVIQLLDDEDEEMLTTCSEVDEAMLRKVVAANFQSTGNKKGDMHAAVTSGRDAALMKAAVAGKADVVSMLVGKGANVNFASVFGDTPLIKAAAAGQALAVARLISLGADVDHANMAGSTALILAAIKGHAAAVKELLNGGARVDKATWWGDTPLINAALHGHTAVVELLLQKGAAVDAQNKHGCTAVIMAARGNHSQAIDTMLEHGANVDHTTKFGDTALLKAAGSGHELAVATLLVGGADANHRNEWGDTALTIAAARGHAVVVERLLDAGANTQLTNKDGKTAIELARSKGNSRCVTLLQMAERQALRGSEAMSFLLTYNGGRLHADLMARLRALPADEARAIRHLASLREVWPLLNDLYGVDSMWHKMRLLDDTLGEYKTRVNRARSEVHELAKKKHPLNRDDPEMIQKNADIEEHYLNALQETCRLYKRKHLTLEARAQQVRDMQSILTEAIHRSRGCSTADPEILSISSQSRQSSLVCSPVDSPVGSPPTSSMMHMAQQAARNASRQAERSAETSPQAEAGKPMQEGQVETTSPGDTSTPEAARPTAAHGKAAASSAVPVPSAKTHSKTLPASRPPADVQPAAASTKSPLDDPQVSEAALEKTVAEAERVLRVARLQLAPAMAATEAAAAALRRAMLHEASILSALNKHLPPVVDRSLDVLKQVGENIDADRILADAATTAGYAAQYQEQLEAALTQFGRTAESAVAASTSAEAAAQGAAQGDRKDSERAPQKQEQQAGQARGTAGATRGAKTGAGAEHVEMRDHPLAR